MFQMVEVYKIIYHLHVLAADASFWKIQMAYDTLYYYYYQPTCQSCPLPLTVKHILVDCLNLDTDSSRFPLLITDNHGIIDFIIETHFYSLDFIVIYIVNLRKLLGNTISVHFFEKSKNVFNVAQF